MTTVESAVDLTALSWAALKAGLMVGSMVPTKAAQLASSMDEWTVAKMVGLMAAMMVACLDEWRVASMAA